MVLLHYVQFEGARKNEEEGKGIPTVIFWLTSARQHGESLLMDVLGENTA